VHPLERRHPWLPHPFTFPLLRLARVGLRRGPSASDLLGSLLARLRRTRASRIDRELAAMIEGSGGKFTDSSNVRSSAGCSIGTEARAQGLCSSAMSTNRGRKPSKLLTVHSMRGESLITV
jgi:hypothetical protein